MKWGKTPHQNFTPTRIFPQKKATRRSLPIMRAAEISIKCI